MEGTANDPGQRSDGKKSGVPIWVLSVDCHITSLVSDWNIEMKRIISAHFGHFITCFQEI